MLLLRWPTSLALTFVLLGPACVFAQRHAGGVPSTPLNSSAARILTSPTGPTVFGSPGSTRFPANNPSYTGYDYGTNLPNTSLPYYSASAGVYRPMAGAGDSDLSLRLNSPEDEELLRAFRPSTGGPPMPVYQPRSGTSLTEISTPTALPATVVVRLPADAQVWFDGNGTRSTGAERSFETPALAVGKTYRYDVKAHWLQEGKPTEVTRRVEVRPGERAVVDFLAPNP